MYYSTVDTFTPVYLTGVNKPWSESENIKVTPWSILASFSSLFWFYAPPSNKGQVRICIMDWRKGQTTFSLALKENNLAQETPKVRYWDSLWTSQRVNQTNLQKTIKVNCKVNYITLPDSVLNYNNLANSCAMRDSVLTFSFTFKYVVQMSGQTCLQYA